MSARIATHAARWARRRGRDARWPQPDFIARPQHPPLAAWVLLAGAALACAAALFEWTSLLAQRDASLVQLERLAQPRRPTIAAAASRGAGARADDGAADAALRLSERVGYRWNALFAGLESVQQPVFWLRLQAEAERGQVALEGTAPTRAALQDALIELSRAPHWQALALNRVELAAQAQTTGTLRFQLNAQCCTRSRAGDVLP